MKLLLVGVGNMGEALLAGWLASGWQPCEIGFIQRSDERAAVIEERYGIARVTAERSAQAEVVVLGVKPYQIADVARALSPHLGSETLVVSLAAGVTCQQLAGALPAAQPVARVMPNTAAQVRQSMAGIMLGEHVSDQQRDQVVELMEAVGQAVVIEEDQVHALIGVAGSAPAFLFYVAEALIEAGVQQGLPRPLATQLVNQTFTGSAAMLQASGASATVLREQVTSPGGATAAGLRSLDHDAVRAGFMNAVAQTADKSRDLTKDQG